MIDGKTVLGVIPARGGSKGVPGKNIRVIAGKPLIAWSLEASHASRFLDRVVVTTDDEAIARVARDWKGEVPFLRSETLARDESPTLDVVLDVMARLPRHDYLVLLQPTSPLRTAADIDACLDFCVRGGHDSVVSVTESDTSPYWMYHLNPDRTMRPLLSVGPVATRRQDLPPTYALNGAIYVGQWEWLLRERGFVDAGTRPYVMPRERSLDLDTELDFKMLQILLEENQHALPATARHGIGQER